MKFKIKMKFKILSILILLFLSLNVNSEELQFTADTFNSFGYPANDDFENGYDTTNTFFFI